MPISRLQEEHQDWDARGLELSKWMAIHGVRVDRLRIPEWLEQQRKRDEERKAQKGKP